MSCLDSIVTLGLCPDDDIPTSGLKLTDAAGITIKNLANIATETYTSGINLALRLKSLALIQLRNDFIGALQANNVVTTISDPVYDTSIFKAPESAGTYAGQRGINLYKMGAYSGLKSLFIKEIQVYPLAGGDGDIVITDGINQMSYPVTFVANQVNTFGANQLSGFPYKVQSHHIRVTIDNTDIPFSKALITCKTGCSGNPNPCGWADGWDGTKRVKEEGYGINLKFNCYCDYEQILCDLDKGFSGELIWLKWQILVFEEQLKSNRFNNWVIYNREELKDYTIPQLQAQYNAKWNDLMNGMMAILETYKDPCLNCRGVRWVTNY